MSTNSYNITPAANWDGPQGTSWVLNSAGSGHHTERRNRAAQIRAQQYAPQPLPRIAPPLQLNDSQSFVDEYRRNYAPHRSVAGSMVQGAVLGYLLVRAAQNRRAR